MTLPSPSIEYFLLCPMLIVFGVAVVGVLVEAFLPRRMRYGAQVTLTVGGLIAAFITVIMVARSVPASGRRAVLGSVAVDRPALFLQGTVLLVAVLAVIFIAERSAHRAAAPNRVTVAAGSGGLDSFTPQASAVPGSAAEHEAERAGAAQTEIFPLLTLSVGGMMVFSASNDLLTMFVALEVLSLPLYLMCGLARHRRLLSQEAALKYFLLGAFSSAFFLYGVALLYGATGTLTLSGIRDSLTAQSDTSMALVGVGLLSVGLLFKVGAVPFHSWIPDVYQGAPTPITGFMAAATKVAAFGALLRVVYVALPPLHDQWRPVLWAISILTMAVATITAVNQTDVKRMLAYSSVAHVGFILTGVIADNQAGLSATLFYLVAYSFSTVGAFAIVGLIRNTEGVEDANLSHWAGLGQRSPIVGVMLSMFLLAFAGIPLTSGFISKFAVFRAAAQGGAVPLVIIGVIASGVAAYFYVRVIVLMFFTEGTHDTPQVVAPGVLSKAAIAICALVTVVLGIFPQPVLDLAEQAAQLLH
ncbi:NADH-quinone oxidoreductase subunit NuoN [Mycobacterium kansasii]|uniref:NADH-quinone oxidoreductase subunit N n=3 Tax=Mycobacterium kansasii TaxID=1768 RepID=A0A1V3XQY0_MYCKA|nr:NADH-quinone oxidoreductase subunit NuoN [Mycobacterium kansasii]EUA03833.1 proton-translocating NADH-quinone oxidoreductase, chain N family protein [Mycobacterium kansasii 824]AGZ52696.1 NADH:ubiquinone oxidoreductase subunit N [Mycobacterium kansasii ATCC 12478]ARG55640.1 NADH-quinone oxidoreductase subunit N [Mycobacterium kansasii]ARG61087.1 NADH-quinone oxidoreductase subunit N [Mycobacterium kansasii]ARG68786.1 NADH-quinone oxidoreductase subunit N [Mycobacterium kansasii]